MPMFFLRMRKAATVYKQTNSELGGMAGFFASIVAIIKLLKKITRSRQTVRF